MSKQLKLERKLPEVRGVAHWVRGTVHTAGVAHRVVISSAKLNGCDALKGNGALGLRHGA